MMQKWLKGIILISFLIGCGSTAETDDQTSETNEVENNDTLIGANLLDESLESTLNINPRTIGGNKLPEQDYIDQFVNLKDETADKILGSYVGNFGKNVINITLTKASEWGAEGYSVCAGNFRKLKGTFDLMEDDHYTFTLEEPGNDRYDGIFNFSLDASDQLITGSWTPFKAEGNSAKKYELKKRSFVYDTSVGEYPQASSRLLTNEDVENMDYDELSFMRNEIYARHGLSFKDKEWRAIFEKCDWYMPMGIDLRAQLTDVEVDNIQLIYDYESYFDAFYDDFGR